MRDYEVKLELKKSIDELSKSWHAVKTNQPTNQPTGQWRKFIMWHLKMRI